MRALRIIWKRTRTVAQVAPVSIEGEFEEHKAYTGTAAFKHFGPMTRFVACFNDIRAPSVVVRKWTEAHMTWRRPVLLCFALTACIAGLLHGCRSQHRSAIRDSPRGIQMARYRQAFCYGARHTPTVPFYLPYIDNPACAH